MGVTHVKDEELTVMQQRPLMILSMGSFGALVAF